ncbi:MAG: DUF3631 domain-containing protein [Chloroflexi bacterium]|nr:DUF3631 domain-containing protein [Chloroflexota bacterium]
MVVGSDGSVRGIAARSFGLGDSLGRRTRVSKMTAMSLAAILDGIAELTRRYLVMGEHERVAIALWVVHTWTCAAADVTPYLQITSAEKRSGKTRVLEVLSLIVWKPWMTGHVSAAVLVRRIARDTPTLLLDESDAAFKGSTEYVETLRGILNEGFRNGGVASLCVGKGKDFELRDFPVFCPKAIAGIGKLPDTIADRSIRIGMKRKAQGEKVERLRVRDAKAYAVPLYDALAKWMPGATLKLAGVRPELPPELDDRAADAWEPLLAIADMAGGDWSERARATAIALSSGDAREDDSLGVRLLSDVRAIFREKRGDRIASADLVSSLVATPEAPWADLYGRPLTQTTLAQKLKPYGVRSHQVRFGPKDSRKGYEAGDFRDAWCRYLPPSESETSETGETADQLASDSGSGDVSAGHPVSPKQELDRNINGTGIVSGNRSDSDVSPVSPVRGGSDASANGHRDVQFVYNDAGNLVPVEGDGR